MKTMAMVALVCAFVAIPAGADMVYWTDWTEASAQSSGTVGWVIGSITLPDASMVSVNYTGEVYPFAQVSGGTNYWNPSTPYVSATVGNAPGTSDIVRLTSRMTHTVTFSQPVMNPVMAIVSLGQYGSGVDYAFDTPFDVLSYGQGYWGNGTLTEPAGNVLRGNEGHGTIQFQGTISSFTWISSPNEHWHGFTVGMFEPVAVPVPGAVLLGLLGLGAAAARLRKRG